MKAMTYDVRQFLEYAEQTMIDGYVVQWDGEPVVKFDWVKGLELFHDSHYSTTVCDEFVDCDLTIDSIKECLTIKRIPK